MRARREDTRAPARSSTAAASSTPRTKVDPLSTPDEREDAVEASLLGSPGVVVAVAIC